MPLLNPGDHFPPITITPADSDPIDLPDALAGDFAVILFNRGSWCPYCNAQLRAFQRQLEKLDGLGIKVVSLSVDDEATARELIARHGLTFPVGHGADAAALHEATGAFVNADPVYLQSTGFVLDPEGNMKSTPGGLMTDAQQNAANHPMRVDRISTTAPTTSTVVCSKRSPSGMGG